MSRRTRIHLLLTAAAAATVASIPADGLGGVVLGLAGAGLGLAALLTLKAGAK